MDVEPRGNKLVIGTDQLWDLLSHLEEIPSVSLILLYVADNLAREGGSNVVFLQVKGGYLKIGKERLNILPLEEVIFSSG
jgi:hypothetical protein